MSASDQCPVCGQFGYHHHEATTGKEAFSCYPPVRLPEHEIERLRAALAKAGSKLDLLTKIGKERRRRAVDADKLYWRPAEGSIHCFKRVEGGGFQSLCDKFIRIERSGGQACNRPPVWQRCGQCDGREADRRGWDGSGKETRRG